MADEVFHVNVDGVGKFTFRRRTYELGLEIESRVLKSVGNDFQAHPVFVRAARKYQDLRVLTVDAPDGWDLTDMDPLDQDQIDQVEKVWEAFREAEDTFREERKAKRKAARA